MKKMLKAIRFARDMAGLVVALSADLYEMVRGKNHEHPCDPSDHR
jgi:hypothetical protein